MMETRDTLEKVAIGVPLLFLFRTQ